MGSVVPSSAAAIALPSAGDFGNYGIVLTAAASDGTPLGTSFSLSLTDIQKLSVAGTTPGAYFQAGNNYLFAVLGDPSTASQQLYAPDGAVNMAYDGRGLHIVAFSTIFDQDAAGP